MRLEKYGWCSHTDGVAVYSVHLHPDGTRFATGGGDNTIRVWSALDMGEAVDTGQMLLTTISTHCGAVNAIKWSHGGKLLASASDDHMVGVFMRQDGSAERPMLGGGTSKERYYPMAMLRGHDKDVHDVAWSPDDTKLASASIDNTVRVWDVRRYTAPTTVAILRGHESWVKAVAWDPAGKFLASISDAPNRSVILWRVWDWTQERRVVDPFLSQSLRSPLRDRLSWSPNGQFLAATNGTRSSVVVLDRGGSEPWSVANTFKGHEGSVFAVRFNPVMFRHTGSTTISALCAVGGSDCVVTVWDSSREKPRLIVRDLFTLPVLDMCWSSDGRMLLVCSQEGTVGAFRLTTEELGEPVSKPEIAELMRSWYGETPHATIAETPMQAVAEEVHKEAPTPPIGPSQPSNQCTSPPPPTHQQEYRTRDGKRRIVPVVVRPLQPSAGDPMTPPPTTFMTAATDPSPSGVAHAATARLCGGGGGGGDVNRPPVAAAAVAAAPPAATPPTAAPPAATPPAATPPTAAPPDVAPPAATPPAATPPAAAPPATPPSAALPAPVSPRIGGEDAAIVPIPSTVPATTSSVPIPQTTEKRKLEQDPASTDARPPAETTERKRSRPARPRRREDGPGDRLREMTNERGSREEDLVIAARPTPMVRREAFTTHLKSMEGEEDCVMEIHVQESGNDACTSTLTVLCKGRMLWSTSLRRRMTLAVGNVYFLAAGCEDGSLFVFSRAGRRLFPPIVLGFPFSHMHCDDHYLLVAVTTDSFVHSWDIRRAKCLVRQDLSPILTPSLSWQKEDRKEIETVTISKAGTPIVTLNNLMTFTFDPGMQTWVCLEDNDTPLSHFRSLIHRTSHGPLASAQKRLAASVDALRASELFGGNESQQKHDSIVHLENKVAAARLVGSSTEFEVWMQCYVEALTQEGMEGKLRELCQELLGPVHPDAQRVSQSASCEWEPCLVGIPKRRLLEDVVKTARKNLALQRLADEFTDLLGHVPEHP